MANSDFEIEIQRKMPHQPTIEQHEAIARIVDFLTFDHSDAVFLLTGYAGTGKTTLVAALVETLSELGVNTVMLAPTGRAAKVMSAYSNHRACTIHKKIYRQNTYQGPDTHFEPNRNTSRNTLFIVDEASMIAAQNQPDAIFGTGDLLEDLMQFVYSSPGCRLMLVGDTAQLPPVGCDQSPALNAGYLEGYGMQVFAASLTEVVRQDVGGILHNATALRQMLDDNHPYTYANVVLRPQIRFAGFADIVNLPGNELIDALQDSYAHYGIDDTVVVTRSNKRAGIYNQGIRARILDHSELLSGGDRVVVVKNNYFWVQPPAPIELVDETTGETYMQEDEAAMSFIANGEGAVVRRYRNVREVYGFSFADVTLQFPDYDWLEVEATAILDTLTAEAPALTRERQNALFEAVYDDYSELKTKRERMRAVREDPLFNALQIKYGYAVTCHKAQGGQWSHVYVDLGYMTDEMLTPDYVRWLYTAITRATNKVFLVNWPKSQTEV